MIDEKTNFLVKAVSIKGGTVNQIPSDIQSFLKKNKIPSPKNESKYKDILSYLRELDIDEKYKYVQKLSHKRIDKIESDNRKLLECVCDVSHWFTDDFWSKEDEYLIELSNILEKDIEKGMKIPFYTMKQSKEYKKVVHNFNKTSYRKIWVLPYLKSMNINNDLEYIMIKLYNRLVIPESKPKFFILAEAIQKSNTVTIGQIMQCLETLSTYEMCIIGW
jgi:hypothetical protein